MHAHTLPAHAHARNLPPAVGRPFPSCVHCSVLHRGCTVARAETETGHICAGTRHICIGGLRTSASGPAHAVSRRRCTAPRLAHRAPTRARERASASHCEPARSSTRVGLTTAAGSPHPAPSGCAHAGDPRARERAARDAPVDPVRAVGRLHRLRAGQGPPARVRSVPTAYGRSRPHAAACTVSRAALAPSLACARPARR
jgi:hypothetical protein